MSFTERVRSYLDQLANRLEEKGIDVDLNDLTLSFSLPGEVMPYLIKVHQVNEEIWLSSPFSGGHRFKWGEKSEAWVNIRTPETLEAHLQTELESKGFSL